MHFRRLTRPNNEAIRTTVRSFESYLNRCLEVQTSSVNGASMTLVIFIDGKQSLKKSVTSSNEAMLHARGMKIGMDLIDAMEIERDSLATRESPAAFRLDGEAAVELRPAA